jgi:tRNA-binding EMAP/Myf-like protein
MQGRYVLAVCNLKSSKFQGIESHAMLLAALSLDGNTIELLDPPAESEIGEKIVFEGYASERNSEILNPKTKVFEKVAENFKVNKEGVATFKDIPFKTSKGVVTVKTLKEGTIG